MRRWFALLTHVQLFLVLYLLHHSLENLYQALSVSFAFGSKVNCKNYCVFVWLHAEEGEPGIEAKNFVLPLITYQNAHYVHNILVMHAWDLHARWLVLGL